MKIAFCIPGEKFSARFLTNWTSLSNELANQNIQFWLSTGYAPVVHIAREKVLEIINENIDFTHVMWIDSDIDFTPNDFFKLLQCNKPVVSGMYRLSNYEDEFSARVNGKWVNREFRANNLNCCEPSLVEAEYVGMGWMLTSIDVYKKLKFPYFDISQTQMEDEMFCRSLTKNGFKINVDLNVIVGHEKIQVLR
tara:strand:+ start:2974 stop:3555 length:582 start_codon:yes stop_codon:yes gene_type:complete